MNPSKELRTTIREVDTGNIRIRVEVPDAEQLLDQHVMSEPSSSGSLDPYWAVLWDASIRTAQFCRAYLADFFQAKKAGSAQSRNVLEIGCGLGVVGIAVAQMGFAVTFTDIVPDAVAAALKNAARNNCANCTGHVLDWRQPLNHRYDIIVGSDVLYEEQLHAPLLNTLQQMLNRGGEVLIGDPGRSHAATFAERATAGGWDVTLLNQNTEPLHAPQPAQFQVLKLVRGQGSHSNT